MTTQPTVAPEVETANADYVVDGDVGIIGAVDFGDGVDVAQTFFQGVEFGGRDEVGPEALSRWLARTPMTVLGMNLPDRGFPALRGAHRNF